MFNRCCHCECGTIVLSEGFLVGWIHGCRTVAREGPSYTIDSCMSFSLQGGSAPLTPRLFKSQLHFSSHVTTLILLECLEGYVEHF